MAVQREVRVNSEHRVGGNHLGAEDTTQGTESRVALSPWGAQRGLLLWALTVNWRHPGKHTFPEEDVEGAGCGRSRAGRGGPCTPTRMPRGVGAEQGLGVHEAPLWDPPVTMPRVLGEFIPSVPLFSAAP